MAELVPTATPSPGENFQLSGLPTLVPQSTPAGPFQPSAPEAVPATSTPALNNPTTNPTVVTYAPNPGLSTGVKAGIGVGVTFGVLIIALAAFLLGAKARRKAVDSAPPQSKFDDTHQGIKPELDGHDRPTPELDGRGVLRWWSRRFSTRNSTVRALNEAEPQELPAEDVKMAKTTSQVQVHHADLPELRTV